MLISRIVAAVLLTAAIAAPAAAAQQPPPAATQEYVPVDVDSVEEQLPAAPLVIGAYSVVWLAVLLYLWSIWQRLARVERDIAQVSERIQAGGNQ